MGNWTDDPAQSGDRREHRPRRWRRYVAATWPAVVVIAAIVLLFLVAVDLAGDIR